MTTHWEQVLKERLKLYGHRNWVVIADSAYPAQSKQGVETIAADDEQVTVVERAFAILSECKHVRPAIYTDKELAFVAEEEAPGVTLYRSQLADLLSGYDSSSLPHEDIISKLDRVADSFRVLLLKTRMQIPYTSVFVELQCGYWSTRAENRLRAVIRSEAGNRHARERSQND